MYRQITNIFFDERHEPLFLCSQSPLDLDLFRTLYAVEHVATYQKIKHVEGQKGQIGPHEQVRHICVSEASLVN